MLALRTSHFQAAFDEPLPLNGHYRLIVAQIDSMLPCVFSVIDHRCRQNVVRRNKRGTRGDSFVSLMFLLHFEVLCDLLLIRRTTTWNLFPLYNNETNYHR